MITTSTPPGFLCADGRGWRAAAAAVLGSAALVALNGCAVASAMGTTASLLVGTVGLAADATIGAARVTGKAIGAAANAVTPGS